MRFSEGDYLVILRSRAIRVKDVAVVVHISSVKNLQELVAKFTARRQVWSDVVKIPEAA